MGLTSALASQERAGGCRLGETHSLYLRPSSGELRHYSLNYNSQKQTIKFCTASRNLMSYFCRFVDDLLYASACNGLKRVKEADVMWMRIVWGWGT